MAVLCAAKVFAGDNESHPMMKNEKDLERFSRWLCKTLTPYRDEEFVKEAVELVLNSHYNQGLRKQFSAAVQADGHGLLGPCAWEVLVSAFTNRILKDANCDYSKPRILESNLFVGVVLVWAQL